MLNGWPETGPPITECNMLRTNIMYHTFIWQVVHQDIDCTAEK